MSPPCANLTVLVGERFACVKIAGRANFNASVNFKTLLGELQQQGYPYIVLELSECALMDSTFLGVLAGFGLKANAPPGGCTAHAIELRNANERLTELLENLGVLHLFRTTEGALPAGGTLAPDVPATCIPSHEELTRASLEAHQTLMELNPENVARFKDVVKFLAEDLKKLRGAR
ncbi:MAG: STAS domain-containing protein [Verrucomicrobiota bacterium]|nr:STAS domain-containing protein [Verrucomicrobiota bacterium]MCC6820387.1 STAS domain-containing protein [Limisphaerales bacterium]